MAGPRRAPHVSSFSPLRLRSHGIPIRFLPGHDYVFHHPRSIDSMVLAQEILAPRLRTEGFTVTETVNGIFFRGFAYIDERSSGESYMVWAIQFKRGTCTGEIGHDLDDAIERNWWPVIRQTWEPADYVLTVEGPCDL